MRRLLLLALLCAPCFGALTTVQDTLYTAVGGYCGGTLTLSWQTFIAQDGHTIYGGSHDFAVAPSANGLTVTVQPGQYTAIYNITPSGCTATYETWIVPVAAAAVNLAAVRSITVPIPVGIGLIPPAWLAQSGATVGQAMCWLGSGAWGPGSCGGGGGGATWGSIDGTLSDQTDLALALNLKQNSWGDWTGTWGTHSPSYFEPALGNPGTSGYVLSSSISGVRSWVPNGGGGGGGSVTVMADGSVVGSTGVVNYLSGAGLNQIISAGSGQINIQTEVDTAVIQTQAGEQGGGALQCASASASGTTYTCGLGPTLDSYIAGMVLHWVPDHNGTGGATTLNVDTLGAVAVKLPDGSSDPTSSSLVAGQMYPVWYDGTVFRLPVAVSSGGGGGGLSAACTWSTLEAGSCGAGSLTAAMTWAQIEAL
jgi:hypothetical protein